MCLRNWPVDSFGTKQRSPFLLFFFVFVFLHFLLSSSRIVPGTSRYVITKIEPSPSPKHEVSHPILYI